MRTGILLLAPLMGAALVAGCAGSPAPRVDHANSANSADAGPSPYRAVSFSQQAAAYYTSVWGVKDFHVRRTASDNLIRFSYRVTNPALAKVLGASDTPPHMIDQRSRAVLQVPVMDKVGQLRQVHAQLAGKEYWMVFSNKGNLVRAGDRVNVSIGAFRVDGLTVE